MLILQIFTWPRYLRKLEVANYQIGQLRLSLYHQPHEDGPAYFPTVATLSLGSHTVLDIFAHSDEENAPKAKGHGADLPTTSRAYSPTPLMSILLPQRSLFILKGDLYQWHLHGIAERRADSLQDLKNCINWDDMSSRRSRWEMGEEADNVEKWERTRRVSLTMRSVEKVLKNVLAR